MEEIKLIPVLDASRFSSEVDDEMADYEINTHYHGDVFYIEWDDDEDYPETKRWLLETFGEEIKKYDQFAINPT